MPILQREALRRLTNSNANSGNKDIRTNVKTDKLEPLKLRQPEDVIMKSFEEAKLEGSPFSIEKAIIEEDYKPDSNQKRSINDRILSRPINLLA